MKCLINLICLPLIQVSGGSRKFYIPGETLEMEKLRGRAIDFGFLSLIGHIDMQLKHDELKSIVERDFWTFLCDEDFEQHLNRREEPMELKYLVGLEGGLEPITQYLIERQESSQELRTQL